MSAIPHSKVTAAIRFVPYSQCTLQIYSSKRNIISFPIQLCLNHCSKSPYRLLRNGSCHLNTQGPNYFTLWPHNSSSDWEFSPSSLPSNGSKVTGGEEEGCVSSILYSDDLRTFTNPTSLPPLVRCLAVVYCINAVFCAKYHLQMDGVAPSTEIERNPSKPCHAEIWELYSP
jgi:hypothetical protein